MEMTLIYTVIGFALAGYSVIANDSIQTLGTFIASKKKWFKWYTLAGSASAVMIIALAWGWYSYDGDISYGRLTRIPYQEIQWYHFLRSSACNFTIINKNWNTGIYYFLSSFSICLNGCARKNAYEKRRWLWFSSNGCLRRLDSCF